VSAARRASKLCCSAGPHTTRLTVATEKVVDSARPSTSTVISEARSHFVRAWEECLYYLYFLLRSRDRSRRARSGGPGPNCDGPRARTPSRTGGTAATAGGPAPAGHASGSPATDSLSQCTNSRHAVACTGSAHWQAQCQSLSAGPGQQASEAAAAATVPVTVMAAHC
jgi:hypothetical protein